MRTRSTSKQLEEHKRKLLIEGIYYQKVLQRHRYLVFVLLLCHSYVLFKICYRSWSQIANSNDSIVCSHAYMIKQGTYASLNILLMLYLLHSIDSRRTLVSNINYFEKTRIFLIFGMMLSFLIVLFKFIPDFLCSHLVLSLEECVLFSLHIFLENFLLFHYFKLLN